MRLDSIVNVLNRIFSAEHFSFCFCGKGCKPRKTIVSILKPHMYPPSDQCDSLQYRRFPWYFTQKNYALYVTCRPIIDQTGGGQEISLAEFYTTVIDHWKKEKKGFVFCGVHMTDLTCFYFTLGLALVSLAPVLYVGSF